MFYLFIFLKKNHRTKILKKVEERCYSLIRVKNEASWWYKTTEINQWL